MVSPPVLPERVEMEQESASVEMDHTTEPEEHQPTWPLMWWEDLEVVVAENLAEVPIMAEIMSIIRADLEVDRWAQGFGQLWDLRDKGRVWRIERAGWEDWRSFGAQRELDGPLRGVRLRCNHEPLPERRVGARPEHLALEVDRWTGRREQLRDLRHQGSVQRFE